MDIAVTLWQYTSLHALSMCKASGVKTPSKTPSSATQISIEKSLKHVSQGPVNPKLTALLYAVRCFFYKNQQMYYREVLQITDPSTLGKTEMLEIELRFLHLLCCLDTARNRVEYDPKDVCNIVTRLAAA